MSKNTISSDTDSSISETPQLLAPLHGADIEAASARYEIPVSDWLDLSAAINPRAYPFVVPQADAMRQLPYSLRAAKEAAKNYCVAPVLPVFAAGSQALIQWLPLVHRTLHTGRRVAAPKIGYAEHAFRWQWAGYDIVFYDPRQPEQIDDLLQRNAVDVLIVITPHNPLAQMIEPHQLLSWHAALQRNQGWLVVDEAFVDAVPQFSLASMTDVQGLIVLRSLGKFFGLAGVRCGYAFCHPSIAKPLEIAVGPWALSSPAVAAATQALNDTAWQYATRKQLAERRTKNVELLMSLPWKQKFNVYQHALFTSIELPQKHAVLLEDYFARRAIRVRRIDLDLALNHGNETALLRFGMIDPENAEHWARMKIAIEVAVCLQE